MPIPLIGQVGPTGGADGTQSPPSLGRLGDTIVSEFHGRYYEAVRRGNLYVLSHALAGVTIALTAGTPALALWNPAGSGLNASLLAVAFWTVSGTPGVGALEIQASATNAQPAVANLTPVNALIGSAKKSAMLGYNQVALGVTPAHLDVFGYITTAPTAIIPSVYELAGKYALGPGSVLGVNPQAAGTTWVAGFSLLYEEVPA